VTNDEIDRLVEYAENSYRLCMNGNVTHINTALRFIPAMVTIIEQLRGELVVAHANEGGHLETVVGAAQASARCSTCGTVHVVA
jgi:ribosomal protein S27E